MTGVHYTQYGQRNISLQQLLQLAVSESSVPQWIDIFGAGPEQVKAIATAFKLHPVTEEDILEINREKLEIFTQYKFYVFNEMKYQATSTSLEITQIKVIIFNKIALSFHHRLATSLPKTIQRIQDEYDGLLESSSWVAYGLLDEVINLDIKVVDEIVRETQLLDSLVLRLNFTDQGSLLQRISACRRKVVDIRTSLWAKREIIKGMTKNCANLEVYLRDVLDHVIVMVEKLTVSGDILNHLGNLYLTRLTLEVSQTSANMNKTMNRFSAVATIFLPLSVLTGLWGMNVRVPGQLIDPVNDSVTWFYSIAGLLLFIATMMGGYFHRHNWL